jgi:hypothetical protein
MIKIINIMWLINSVINFMIGYKFYKSQNGVLRFLMYSYFYSISLICLIRAFFNFFEINELIISLVNSLILLVVSLSSLIYIWQK